MELRTERLLLREFHPSDMDVVHAYQSRPEYRQYYTGAPPAREDTRAFVQMLCGWADEVPRSKYQLAITHEGALIGTCGVRMAERSSPEAEFGCELDPEFWGRGYAREASRAILTFAREQLGLQRIVALTTANNSAAGRLALSLGFRMISPERYELRLPPHVP